MIGRTNLILAGLLVVQVAVLVGRELIADEPTPGAGAGPFLTGVTADALTTLTIAAKEAGDEVTLTRGTPADPWLVVEADRYPADPRKVADTLRELLALEIADVVSTSGTHHRDLGVDPETAERHLRLEGGGEKIEVLFGAAGRANSLHARRVGEDRVVAVRNYQTWKLSPTPDTWLDHDYFKANRQLVTSAVFENPKGSLRLTRIGRDFFAVEEGGVRTPLDNDAVDELLGKAGRVSMRSVAGRVADLPGVMDSPVATLVLALRAPEAPPAPSAGVGGAAGAGGAVGGADAPGAAPSGSEGSALPIGDDAVPAVSETRVLRIAAKPGATDVFYLHADGSEFIVEASRWGLTAVLEAEKAKLLPKAGPEAQPPAGAPTMPGVAPAPPAAQPAP